jgi:hypothetical protein
VYSATQFLLSPPPVVPLLQFMPHYSRIELDICCVILAVADSVELMAEIWRIVIRPKHIAHIRVARFANTLIALAWVFLPYPVSNIVRLRSSCRGHVAESFEMVRTRH